MTYIQRKTAEAQAAAAELTSLARATRRVTTLEGQVQRAKSRVSLAEGRRRQANASRGASGNRLQSTAEVKARARVTDLEIELSAVRARVAELSD